MQQTGVIKSIGQKQQVSDKFVKRDLVIAFKDGSYDKLLCIQFTQNNVDRTVGYQVGQEVTVDFNLESKEHNGKYFTNCTGWKITPTGQQSNYATGATGRNDMTEQNFPSQSAGNNAGGSFYNVDPGGVDDLPFRHRSPRIDS